MGAAMLLSSYELMAASGLEHRKHYEGAMKLIKMRGINGQSIGFDKANFWIWARHEITIAISNESPLQTSPKYWNVDWEEENTKDEALGNQMLWLVGRAVDWVYGDGNPSLHHELLQDSERWYKGLSKPFRGLYYGEPVDIGLSKIHFASSAAGKFTHFFTTPLS